MEVGADLRTTIADPDAARSAPRSRRSNSRSWASAFRPLPRVWLACLDRLRIERLLPFPHRAARDRPQPSTPAREDDRQEPTRFARLAQGEPPVFIVRGLHDATRQNERFSAGEDRPDLCHGRLVLNELPRVSVVPLQLAG